jgi:hypothetical protein
MTSIATEAAELDRGPQPDPTPGVYLLKANQVPSLTTQKFSII